MQEGNPVLAYVFWHWKRAEITATDYEHRQRAFHAALAVAPPPGLLGSFSVSFSHAPWASGDGEAYEDWYLVRDFGALGLLNEAAVSASRAPLHEAAAAVSAGMVCSVGPCCVSHSTPIGLGNPMGCPIANSLFSSRRWWSKYKGPYGCARWCSDLPESSACTQQRPSLCPLYSVRSSFRCGRRGPELANQGMRGSRCHTRFVSFTDPRCRS